MGLDTLWRGSIVKNLTTQETFDEQGSEEASEIVGQSVTADAGSIQDDLRSMKMDEYKSFIYKDYDGTKITLFVTKFQL